MRDRFPGNLIPPARINPIAKKVLSYYPAPNSITPGVAYTQTNYYAPDNWNRDDFFNVVYKLDTNLGDRHRLFFRHANNKRTENTQESGAIMKGPGQTGERPSYRVNNHLTADWVATLRPTFIFNFRVSFNRYLHTTGNEANVGFDLSSFGFPASMLRQLPRADVFGYWSFDGYSSMGRHPSGNWTNTWAVHPTSTWIAGSHTFKFGVDVRYTQYAERSWEHPLYFSTSRVFTQQQFNQSDALSGNSIAAFLLGFPSSGRSDFNAFPIAMYPYKAPYIQDDWKVTRRLTVNLGFRWDFNSPPDERFNRLNRYFDASVVSPADRLVNRAVSPTLPQLRGGLLFAGVGGQPRAAADLYKRALQPRFGMAYQIRPRVVFRGGWGRFFVNPTNNYLQRNGFSTSTPYVASGDENRTPLGSLSNPFPAGINLPAGSSLGLATFFAAASASSTRTSSCPMSTSSPPGSSLNCRAPRWSRSATSATAASNSRATGPSTSPTSPSASCAVSTREAPRPTAMPWFRTRSRVWTPSAAPATNPAPRLAALTSPVPTRSSAASPS